MNSKSIVIDQLCYVLSQRSANGKFCVGVYVTPQLLEIREEDIEDTSMLADAQLAASKHPWLSIVPATAENASTYVEGTREDWIAQATKLVGQEAVTKLLLELEET